MKVNVLMTVYNDGNRFLKKSIQSILDQSYENIELIIVNDGSTDSTDEIIQSYLQQDERIIYINRKVNRGRVYSLNEGLKYCMYDLVFINDADDISYPRRIEEGLDLYNRLGKDKKNFGLLGSGYVSNDLKHSVKTVYKLKTWGIKNQIPMWRLLISMPYPHSSVMYNRNALMEVSGFSKEVTAGIDYLTLLKIANKFKVYGINEVLIERIIDGNNFFMQKNINNLTKKNTEIINLWLKENVKYLKLKKLPYYAYKFIARVRRYKRKKNGDK